MSNTKNIEKQAKQSKTKCDSGRVDEFVIFCGCVREIDNGDGKKNFCRACGKEIEKI